ncbi:E3 ubiquitin-protein ligase UHRF2-like isoform X2 [Scomber scombrus]|uniref:E3 ubiquitin-protein ligase UHRF2-like isoform X2 n=1 Tax=Scomber scombrus TaxID=13677 RepID=A0AAV1PYR6_SCOSC
MKMLQALERSPKKIEELILASLSRPDVTAAIRELINVTATQRVTLTHSQLQTIKQGFSCVVCLSKYAMINEIIITHM